MGSLLHAIFPLSRGTSTSSFSFNNISFVRTLCFRRILAGLITGKVRSYIARYPVLGTVQSPSHFTPWQT